MAQKSQPTRSNVLPSSWDLVRPSLELVRQNIDTLLWLVILPALLLLLANQLTVRMFENFSNALNAHPTLSNADLHTAFHNLSTDLTKTTQGKLAISLFILGGLWNFLVYPAVVALLVFAVRHKDTDISHCLQAGWKNFWRVYGISLLIGLLVVTGLVLLVIPGFIFLRRYVLAPFYLVDEGLTIREAMSRSAAQSKPSSSYIWGTLGVMLVFNVLGSLCGAIPYIGFIIGLAVGYVYYFGLALRYQTVTAAAASRPTKK